MYLIDFIHIDGTPTEVAEIKAICIKHKSLFKNELGPEPARIPPFDFKKLDIPQWKHFRNRGAPRVASTMRQYGLKRGLGRRTEVSVVGARRRGTREDVVRRVNVVIIGYS